MTLGRPWGLDGATGSVLVGVVAGGAIAKWGRERADLAERNPERVAARRGVEEPAWTPEAGQAVEPQLAFDAPLGSQHVLSQSGAGRLLRLAQLDRRMVRAACHDVRDKPEELVSNSVWPTVHEERRVLADDLAGLTAEQWAAQSLCSEWNVHQVLAHLLSAAKMTPPKFLVRIAAARFKFDDFAAKQVALESAGGPAATLAAVRAVETRESAPPGPKETWLGEAFVHGEDIRRPLGIRRAYPLPEVVRVIGLYARSNTIIGGKSRVAGLTLRASDIDYSIGSGPVVEGPAISLLLAASGRKSALDELSGPGVHTLRERP